MTAGMLASPMASPVTRKPSYDEGYGGCDSGTGTGTGTGTEFAAIKAANNGRDAEIWHVRPAALGGCGRGDRRPEGPEWTGGRPTATRRRACVESKRPDQRIENAAIEAALEMKLVGTRRFELRTP